MGFFGNDRHTQGRLIELGSIESADAKKAAPTDPALPHRRIGWWPGLDTVLKFLLVAVVIIIAIGWALTLLN